MRLPKARSKPRGFPTYDTNRQRGSIVQYNSKEKNALPDTWEINSITIKPSHGSASTTYRFFIFVERANAMVLKAIAAIDVLKMISIT